MSPRLGAIPTRLGVLSILTPDSSHKQPQISHALAPHGAALQDSKQAAPSTPRRPAPTLSVETTFVFIKAKNQHSARPRPSARQPTPSVEQLLKTEKLISRPNA
ncbi:hypothetical protein PIB30_084512 [Stylosanthes scabra]|uniref:Uncharacterized protein n=1 Tax=Stylosanthes scabra TaxID=79078 RepID=A0ABU6XSR8_9FABA|nr:hypothetical protein [Stylosanthes scabra]